MGGEPPEAGRGHSRRVKPGAPARAIHCARDIVENVKAIGVEVRCGIHAGEMEILGNDVAGLAVHIGARISSLAGASEILVSRTVRDLVTGSGFDFDDRGTHPLKGVPDEWQVYAVNQRVEHQVR